MDSKPIGRLAALIACGVLFTKRRLRSGIYRRNRRREFEFWSASLFGKREEDYSVEKIYRDQPEGL